jgi:lipopolysaccharide export system protein LptA
MAAFFVLCIWTWMTGHGQTEKVIILEHADSLVGRVIDGEQARELIGNVAISQGDVHIGCDRALQLISRGTVFLAGNVVIRDDSLTLRAPRGVYHRDEHRAEAFDDVLVDDGRVRVLARYGEYFVDPRRVFFRSNVYVADSTSVIAADSLTYWRETRKSLALGRVCIHSITDNVTVYGGRLEHDAGRSYSRVTLAPFLIQLDTTGGRIDTLQVRARVLEAYRDSTHRLVASDSVRIVRSDMAAIGNYACYYMRGDSIYLRSKPVLWYRDTQVIGDSVNIYLHRRKLERLYVGGNAFAASRGDSIRPDRIDQMVGDVLAMRFGESGLQAITLAGRAISLYHLYDDSSANGLNKTSGDRILMHFADGRAESITVYGGVEGQYVPENLVAHRESEYALPGFFWRTDRPHMSRFTPFIPPPEVTRPLP